MNDTIAAISTALGVSAISIIRVSGQQAISIVDNIFTANLLNKDTHTITYGYIKDGDNLIDEVLITIMKAPKSFTMEDVVEINCHGGIATTKKVLELLIKNGCRLAEPGEFTKRAFLNGRIDLNQAEAIMDLINVSNENARRIAIDKLKGKTTKEIEELRKIILDILTNISVNIDYPEYLDIEVMTNNKVKDKMTEIKDRLGRIIDNSKNSKIIKDGINVAIIGRPNVGKSSILNTLMQEEKAIVTDIPGTTRDIVEASINFDGIILNLIDTAGIRTTTDVVEKIGVERSKEQMNKADLILFVLNNNLEITDEDINMLDEIKDKNVIVVINKNDLPSRIDLSLLKDKNIVYTNTLTSKGIDSLKEQIKKLYNLGNIKAQDFNYVSNINQLNLLNKAYELIKDVEKALKENLPIDMIEIDLKEMWNILGEIIGKTYSEEFLDQLFSDFCVGK